MKPEKIDLPSSVWGSFSIVFFDNFSFFAALIFVLFFEAFLGGFGLQKGSSQRSIILGDRPIRLREARGAAFGPYFRLFLVVQVVESVHVVEFLAAFLVPFGRQFGTFFFSSLQAILPVALCHHAPSTPEGLGRRMVVAALAAKPIYSGGTKEKRRILPRGETTKDMSLEVLMGPLLSGPTL